MAKVNKRLTVKQLKAIDLLTDFIDPKTKKLVAQGVRVSRKTLYEWMKIPKFMKKYREMADDKLNAWGTVIARKSLLARMPKDTRAIQLYFEKAEDWIRTHGLGIVVKEGLTPEQDKLIEKALINSGLLNETKEEGNESSGDSKG